MLRVVTRMPARDRNTRAEESELPASDAHGAMIAGV